MKFFNYLSLSPSGYKKLSKRIVSRFSIRSYCDLENAANDFKVCNNFFLSESLKTCDNIASNNLQIDFTFLQFIIANAKTNPNTLT